MERIDEMSNEELARQGHSDHWLRLELDRVDALTTRLAMTGDDLSHWYERRKILSSLIRSGSRAA